MRSGLFLPLFDPLADPVIVARLSVEAEEAGWHGVFVWDHVRWREPVVEVADPWITLAAIATSTASVRLGPTGGARGCSTSRWRSSRPTWSGEPVHHRGEHYTVDGMRFLPRPIQRPGVPVWVAGFHGKPKPLRRAARYQGFFPVNLEHPDQLADIVAQLTALRQDAGRDAAEPYDVVAALPPGGDPAPYAAAGATWWVVDFPGDAVSVDQVRGVIREGPFGPG